MSIRIALTIMAATAVCTAHAQTAPVAAPTGQKSLSATMNVYVFPNAGQATSQQSKDEGECYNWAVQNTGSDPFQIAKQEEQQQQQTAQQEQQAKQAGKGTGAKGALGGAAAGALIGEIASDDAGKGAAIGAGVGLVGGRMKARKQQEQATEQAQQQGQAAAQASAGQLDNFKKAFSVCLEAKKYMVKY
ncbi:MAG: glycine zipper domain-containing protein [Gammaproteobacteria bacterium]